MEYFNGVLEKKDGKKETENMFYSVII
jgi:hypothetical protein